MHDHALFRSERLHRLNDLGRLETQLSEADLARLLALRGDEDVLDLGSGTGFYTDRIAALTTGTVYAVELQSEMIEHYRERGVPANVRLVSADITALGQGALPSAGVDVACTIATWHEIGGRLDLAGLSKILRPRARLIVIDWRKDPESWDGGPPEDIRVSKEQVADALASHFPSTHAEDLGRFMFAVTARR
jgi:SAM-dependent methyltransferase